MALSNDLISQFAKLTNEKKKDTGTSLKGTFKLINGLQYVQIDGSEILTPVTITVEAVTDERVIVLIKDHMATVTENITSPAARNKSVQDIKDEVDEFGNTIQQIDNTIIQQGNSIIQMDSTINQQGVTILQHETSINQQGDNIVSIDNTILQQGNSIESINNTIVTHGNNIDSMNNTIVIHGNDIDSIDNTISQQGNTISQQGNTISQQGNQISQFGDTIVSQGNAITLLDNEVSVQDSEILILNSGFSIINGVLTGLSAVIVNSLKTGTLDATYATIDFANIEIGAIETLFTASGIIKDLIVQDEHITGELVGVTLKGDLIEGNTIVADKLVVKGADGIYYKLNIDGETIETEQTDQNSLNGSVITAKSITASKITVDDLVAFGATIAGFIIDDNSIHSTTKSTIDSNVKGLYFDKDGQFYLGDDINHVKFYKDINDAYVLDIRATNMFLGASEETVGEQLSVIEASANTANGLLADITSDSKLTPDEKQTVKREYDIIISEKTLNDTQADLFGVSKTDYGTKYTTWKNYIDPLLTSLTTTSDIVGETFRNNFKNYYDARTNLLNTISTKAKTLADTASDDMNIFIDTVFEDFRDSVDSHMTVWFYSGIPNLINEPAVNWITSALLLEHLNDMYFDRNTGYYYEFVYDGVYQWTKRDNADVVDALALANAAQGTANNKKRIFYNILPSIPQPPYDNGDAWFQGATGDIMRVLTPRLIDATTYGITDWTKGSRYTDDTIANKAAADIFDINNDLDINVESSKLGQLYKSIKDFTFAFTEKGFSNLVPNSVLIHGSANNAFFTKIGTWETIQNQNVSANTIANYISNCTSAGGKLEWIIRTIPNTAYTLGAKYNNTINENSSIKINNSGIIIDVVNTSVAAVYEKAIKGFIATGSSITITIETNGTHFGYSDLMLNFGVLNLITLEANALTWQPAAGEITGTNIVMSQEGITIYMLQNATGTYILKHIMDASGSRIVDGNNNIITSFDVEGIVTNRITLVDATGTGTTQIDIGNFTILDLAAVVIGGTTEYNNLEY